MHLQKINLLLATLLLLSCGHKEKEKAPPLKSKNPTVIKKATRVALTNENIDNFITWASGSSVNEKEQVRDEINKAAKDTAIAGKLFEKFEKIYTSDLGYSLILLSIIGELKQPGNYDRLENIIWRKIPARTKNIHAGLDSADAVEMLSSKAAECMAYLNSAKSDAAMGRVIRDHASLAVRSAAIDAWLFSKNDSPEAKTYLQRIVRKEDQPLIYRGRFLGKNNKAVLNRQLAEFNNQFPQTKAPAPEPGQFVTNDTSRPEKRINPPKREGIN